MPKFLSGAIVQKFATISTDAEISTDECYSRLANISNASTTPTGSMNDRAAVDELNNSGAASASNKVIDRRGLLNASSEMVRAFQVVTSLSDIVLDQEVGKVEFQVGGNTGGISEISTAITFNGKDASGSRDYHTADFTSFPLLPSFTVGGTLPAAGASNARALAWCSNETGGATVIYSDGTNWRRVYDNAVAS